MKDERLYAKFTLDFPDHPKILCLSVEAKWALVDLTIYSRRHMTDGFIPKAVALAKHGLDVCQELATNDAANPSLIESENGFQIHDFALHQSTKAEIEDRTEKRRRAGQKGGRARAQAHAKQVLKQKASKSKPEPETETETRETTSLSLPADVAVALVHDEQRETPMIPIPDNWGPSDMHRAKYPRPDLDQLADGFRDHAISVGRLCNGPAGWNAAFGNWVRKSPPPGAGTGSTTDDRIAKIQALKTPAPSPFNSQRSIG